MSASFKFYLGKNTWPGKVQILQTVFNQLRDKFVFFLGYLINCESILHDTGVYKQICIPV